mmetsp:Transcript_38680/g.125104  ORF Transcript_38680/g.125104 Transcript_38680/m.125104 type:complete len:219 (+) Transcript_38680:677-1333(+)
MKTRFDSGGSASRSARPRAAKTCASTSSVSSERKSPIVPVAQKRQPCRQPTCEETQSVLRARAFRARPPPASSGHGGISTVSTSCPSLSRSSSLRVPSEVECSRTTGATCDGEVWVASDACAAAPSPSAPAAAAAGSRPLRRWRQTLLAPAPPTRETRRSYGSDSSEQPAPTCGGASSAQFSGRRASIAAMRVSITSKHAVQRGRCSAVAAAVAARWA